MQALTANTTASNNTAVGYQALYTQSTGGPNTAVGYQSLYYVTSGSNNTSVGYQSLTNVNTGSANNGFGNNAGGSITSGTNNVTIGASGGAAITSGSYNICIGSNAGANGLNYTVGTYGTIVGTYSDFSANNTDHETVIGAGVTGKGSQKAFIGGTSGAYNGANTTTWATTSDQRIKKNIVSIDGSLSKILALNPVEFDYKENDKHEVGFIAQEFETVFPDQIIHHAPTKAEKEMIGDDTEVMGIQQNLVPYLVKAIQELKAEVDSLKQQLGK